VIELIKKPPEEARELAKDRVDELRALLPGIRHRLRQEEIEIGRALKGLSTYIPSIPNDDEVIPHKPPTMQQQEEGWGYNEREFIGEDMPKRTGLLGPGPAKEPKRERKQKKRGAVRIRVKAQAPKLITAAEIEPKRRPELRGK